eukprot:gene5797-4155_t
MIRVHKNWLGDLATLRLQLAPQSLLNFNEGTCTFLPASKAVWARRLVSSFLRLLIVEDSIQGIAVDLETEDDFVDILAIPVKHSTDTHGDVMPQPSHMMPSSTWGAFEDILFDFSQGK